MSRRKKLDTYKAFTMLHVDCRECDRRVGAIWTRPGIDHELLYRLQAIEGPHGYVLRGECRCGATGWLLLDDARLMLRAMRADGVAEEKIRLKAKAA